MNKFVTLFLSAFAINVTEASMDMWIEEEELDMINAMGKRPLRSQASGDFGENTASFGHQKSIGDLDMNDEAIFFQTESEVAIGRSAIVDDMAMLQTSPGGTVKPRVRRRGLRKQYDADYTVVPLTKQYIPMLRDERTFAYKTTYFGDIRVGAEDTVRHFSVVFDSGSGNLILPSMECSSVACENKTKFVPPPPEKSMNHSGHVAITFGTGDVDGGIEQDSVCLGKTDKTCLQLRLITANNMSDDPFSFFSFDGILGLGIESLSERPQFSLHRQVVEQHPHMEPSFAVLLGRLPGDLSAVSFGGYDPTWATSNTSWHSVVNAHLGYWQIGIKSVRVGDEEYAGCANSSCRAILDSGTSLLGVPQQSLRPLQSMLTRQLPMGTHPRTDCRTLPGKAITFELEGGFLVHVNPQDYSRPMPWNITTNTTEEGWSLFCRGILMPTEEGEPIGSNVFLWGEPVLRQYLTIFNWEEQKIGIAASARIPRSQEMGASQLGAPEYGTPHSFLPGSPMTPEITV